MNRLSNSRRSNNRKLLLQSVLLLIGVFISLSCREASTNKLRFAHFWSEPAQRIAIDSLVAGFHREHPEIEVEVTELSWNDGKTKLMLGFNSETAPDILELGSDWVPQFSSSGVLLNLTMTDDSSLRAHMATAPGYAIPLGRWNRDMFAMPWLLDTRVMFVNDDLVQKSGSDTTRPLLKDWSSVERVAKAISAHGDAGCGVNGSDEHRLYKKFLPFVWSNGGEIFSEDGKPTLSRPENIEALREYVAQEDYGKLESQKNLDDAFKRGTLGIWFSGSWMIKPLAKASFRWHTELVPGNNGHHGTSFAGGEYLAINAKTKMKPHAIQFLAYVTRPENQLRFAKAVNMFPADTAGQLDSFYLNRKEGAVFGEQLRYARMTPVLSQWLEVESIIEEEVARALYHKESPERAMTSAQARVEELLREP